ncbi:MAG: alpha/beta hydrolase [Oscillospiraceae bacterium]|nr:alpha/beta hydrolase [Oscillospiraceae bacterium]
MSKQTFKLDGKSATMYLGKQKESPLILLNNYSGDGESVVSAMQEIDTPDCNLLVVGDLNWDHDMTPWYCPPLSKNDTPCTGGADEYLDLLLTEILPKAKELIDGTPSFIGIAGYSLAGLFALYAAYRCDAFDRVTSMSGSLWFPDFKEYALTHEMRKRPAKLYLSLGDREGRTRNSVLMTVQRNTEELVEHYRSLGLDVTWELNPGNHFKDAALRSAKGIRAILE